MLLFADTVLDEVQVTLGNHLLDKDGDQIDRFLEGLALDGLQSRYPRDLSAGEKQRAALAAVTVTEPGVILLDEPTRGIDYVTKKKLAEVLLGWRDSGKVVLLVTHDVEMAARIADRAVLMDQGRIIADGDPYMVFSSSDRFSPQTVRLFPGKGWLTPEDVPG